MIKIAITPQHTFPDEYLYIPRVLDAGWQWLHLRHPFLSEEEMRTLIESIDGRYYSKIKLHSYPGLVEEYQLGGVHLNSRMPSVNLDPAFYSISRSCHSIGEVRSQLNREMDYVTLSPVFDSLSKQGYQGQFNADQLADIPSTPPVIALGGITPERVQELAKYHFAGYAVLGYLAQATSPDNLSTLLSHFK